MGAVTVNDALSTGRQLQRHRFEAVLRDLEPRAVVEDRGPEHELVVELGLDEDDVHAGIALLPVGHRPVEPSAAQMP